MSDNNNEKLRHTLPPGGLAIGDIDATAADWIDEELEELGEAIDSGDIAGTMDAYLDLLGVCLCALNAHGAASVMAAHASYVDAQRVRSRPLDAPHMAAIAAAIPHIANQGKGSRSILSTRWLKITSQGGR